MGIFLSTVASLMLTYGSIYGVERLLDRFGTYEARAEAGDAFEGEANQRPSQVQRGEHD